MTDQHPITPPSELLQQWATEYWGNSGESIGQGEKYIANQAARWGADKELEACIEWLWKHQYDRASVCIRAARRPKPPILAEEALEELDLVPTHDQDGRSIDADTSVIRRALERLKELENTND